jgi:dihydroorotase
MADFGIIGLETLFGVANTYNVGLSLEDLIDKITIQPRKILRLAQPQIAEGSKANLTVFEPEKSGPISTILSNSKNTPFLGKTFKGKALVVIA